MSRTRTLLTYGLYALGLAVLFTLFIWFKSDTALVAALSAAGTVAAAGFAAVAAIGSMRAAAESSATARRSRETLGRATRPHVYPSLSLENGTAVGKVHCGTGRAAIDMNVLWLLKSGESITEQIARLEPGSTLDIKQPDAANPWEEIDLVWVDYWDDSQVGHWQDTWRVDAEQARFRQTDSELAD